MIKVKICGITNLFDALVSARSGCDALGFVFYRKSPRYIEPEKAKAIISQLPPHIIKIGVFVNARENNIKRIAKVCSLDMLQFHGNESPEFCLRFKKNRVIKAFRVRGKLDRKKILKYKPFAYLFDTFLDSKVGGTGKNFDWRLVRHVDGLARPVFLSGGLTEKNVKEAIHVVKPEWIDVSSSVEERLGKKDQGKVKRFIRVVKSA